jgi:hypothetical protein
MPESVEMPAPVRTTSGAPASISTTFDSDSVRAGRFGSRRDRSQTVGRLHDLSAGLSAAVELIVTDATLLRRWSGDAGAGDAGWLLVEAATVAAVAPHLTQQVTPAPIELISRPTWSGDGVAQAR